MNTKSATLVNRLNMTCGWNKSDRTDAVSFDRRTSIDFYETIHHYVAHHDVGVDYNDIEPDDIQTCAGRLSEYTYGCSGVEGDYVTFWFDK